MRIWIAAAAALSIATPALAQGPIGIAIVEAPEQSGGVCFADNLDKAFDCARAQCVDGGALRSDCYRVRWCYPAGWSADVFIQNKDGFHFHDYLCGWDSRETLEAAARIKCDATLRDTILDCALVRMWNDDGEAVEMVGTDGTE